MDFATFGQQIINGVAAGMGYVLIATGLTLVFGVLRIVNFAHGEFYMLGAYFANLALTLAGLPYLAAVAAAVLGSMLVGLLINRVLFQPLAREHEFVILLLSLGLAIFIANSAELLFGADPKYLSSPYADNVVDIGPVNITEQRVLIIGVAAAVILALYAFLRYSRYGKMMQATAEHVEGAALTGINVRLVHAYTFAIACGLAGLSGALVAPTGMLSPNVGDWAVLKGFIVVVLGGLGSVAGAVVGGLLLGVVESLGGGYVSLGFKEAIGYALIIAVLLWRPAGLFAKRPD